MIWEGFVAGQLDDILSQVGLNNLDAFSFQSRIDTISMEVIDLPLTTRFTSCFRATVSVVYCIWAVSAK